MQFTPAGASAAHQKLGARPSGPSVKAASASGAPEHARVAQSAKLMASGHRVRVWAAQLEAAGCISPLFEGERADSRVTQDLLHIKSNWSSRFQSNADP